MNQYIDNDLRVWTFDESKQTFTIWVANDPVRLASWRAASGDHSAWLASNPGADPGAYTGTSAEIFGEWVTYANAITIPTTE